MKKHMILAAGVALVTAAISVFAFVNNEKNSIDELFNANVEALADNENVNYIICYSESEVKVGYTYYDCGSCSKVYDEKGRGHYSKCFR